MKCLVAGVKLGVMAGTAIITAALTIAIGGALLGVVNKLLKGKKNDEEAKPDSSDAVDFNTFTGSDSFK